MGNAPFLADSYFGHRTRLYNLDLLRNPNNVSKIIEKSYECGVRSINLANYAVYRIKTENENLKNKVNELNKENFKLKNALNSFKPLVCGFFVKKEEENILF